MKKKSITIAIIAAIIIIGLYIYLNPSNPDNSGTVCATDVKQCSDGSYVGRDSSNNCEFSACPETEAEEQPETQSQNYDIIIREYAFYPALLNIKAGDTVTWTNKDDDSHTVRSDPTGGEINSTKLKWNEKYTHTFTQTGNYTYYCSLHAGMRAKIVVE